MPGGGSKPGERRGGRKKGSGNLKSRMIADKAMAEGITPLEVMLETMRELYHEGKKLDACAIAKDAAPYVHPRLQAIEHAGKNGDAIQVETKADLTEGARKIVFMLSAAAAELSKN